MTPTRRAQVLTVAAFLQGQHALAGGGRVVALWVADPEAEHPAEAWRDCFSATLADTHEGPMIHVRSVGRATLSRGS